MFFQKFSVKTFKELILKNSMKYYIDTSIWRDFHEGRTDKFRPLGEWAFELFRKIKLNREIVLFSDLVIDELLIRYTILDIEKIFSMFSKESLLEKAGINIEQRKEAKQLAQKFQVPCGDALHSILARDNEAILISRDAHFIELRDVVEVKKPEELL